MIRRRDSWLASDKRLFSGKTKAMTIKDRNLQEATEPRRRSSRPRDDGAPPITDFLWSPPVADAQRDGLSDHADCKIVVLIGSHWPGIKDSEWLSGQSSQSEEQRRSRRRRTYSVVTMRLFLGI